MRTNSTHTKPFRIGIFGALILVGAALALTGGCQQPQKTESGGDLLGPFDVLGLMRKPVRVGETNLEFTPPPLLLPKRGLFRDALSEQLKEPVQFELMTPRQIRVHLATGRMSFALVKPHELPEVISTDACEILAVGINNAGKTYRQGLIITAPNSPIKSIADTKGVRFHMLPPGDLLNDAALGALMDAGVPVKALDLGLLGLSLGTTHINSLEVAKSVVLENKVAGVIDEADYEKWADKGGSLVLLTPSKDQVRVIGKTMRVPEWPFLISKKVTSETREKASNFLFKVAPVKYKLALAMMDVKGFAPPIAAQDYEAFAALHATLHPKSAAASRPAEADSQPAGTPQ